MERSEIEIDEVGLVLKQARRLLERGWCQEMLARNAAGTPCDDQSPDAVQFCAVGAIYRATGDLMRAGAVKRETCPQISRVATAAIRHLGDKVGRDVVSWNNDWNRTHEQVLKGFDRAGGGK